jgi:hypothetical protein
MAAGAGAVLSQTVWVFYAFGPQLVICLVLAHYAARRSTGDLMTWLVVGFLVSVIPVAGVVAMLALFRLARKEARGGAP